MKWDVSSTTCALSGPWSALWDGARGLTSTKEAGRVLGDVGGTCECGDREFPEGSVHVVS